jgi:nucleoside-diphosphate-sugar epimerase
MPQAGSVFEVTVNDSPSMRVLLTGSSGWLGRFLAPRLWAAGHVVIGLDVAPGAATHVVGSVADITVVERVFGDHNEATLCVPLLPRHTQRSGKRTRHNPPRSVLLGSADIAEGLGRSTRRG